jgi:hypothetical protein
MQTHAMSMEDIEITHALTLRESNYSIRHELNPDTGDYKVLDKNSNKLIHFDANRELKPSSLHAHIQSKTQEVKDITDTHQTNITTLQSSITGHATSISTLQSQVSTNTTSIGNHHSTLGKLDTDLTTERNRVNTLTLTTTNNVTRLTALEGIVSGGEGLEIDNILTVGNDAGGLEIIGLSNVSSDMVTIGGIPLTSVEGVLTCDNNVNVGFLTASVINCITGGDTLLGKSIVDDSTMFAVRCNSNQIVSYSDAELVGFKTIDDMTGQISDLTNRLVVLEQYNTQLMELVLSISQSLLLKDAGTGLDFNYTGLIPE